MECVVQSLSLEKLRGIPDGTFYSILSRTIISVVLPQGQGVGAGYVIVRGNGKISLLLKPSLNLAFNV